MALTVLVNVVGNLLLIQWLGLSGSATATAVSMVASVVFLKLLVRARLGVRI
jgi:Na+-driven multidrug efflux pump